MKRRTTAQPSNTRVGSNQFFIPPFRVLDNASSSLMNHVPVEKNMLSSNDDMMQNWESSINESNMDCVLDIPRGGSSASRTKKRMGHSSSSNLESQSTSLSNKKSVVVRDGANYAILIALYTLQGIPMGLSASIPFLIQSKKGGYNAQAMFALCSWPFSLKLLWAPIVDALYLPKIGRRKTWLIPIQLLAGSLMVGGSSYMERQFDTSSSAINVKGVTLFFFILYLCMATQDIAVDGWALTMLAPQNKGKGPVCNSIGQNFGYFLSFVGFLAFHDIDSCNNLWRPLLRLPSNPDRGLVTLGGFLSFMGYTMLTITTLVALFKPETSTTTTVEGQEDDGDEELDAAQIGLKETYRRLWKACQLPAVQQLFLLLISYRFPTSLSDNVKFLKAVEYGLSKQTTALLSPLVILPLGIAVPILAHTLYGKNSNPLSGQFLSAYKARVTIVPLLDILLLNLLQQSNEKGLLFWIVLISSTAIQAIVQSLQFNAQMIFFAHRVDPAIGGSYMTLLNTAANLGGTWPASTIMYLLGIFSKPKTCTPDGMECSGGKDAYIPLQLILSILGMAWLYLLTDKVKYVANLPDDDWKTHIGEDEKKRKLEKENPSRGLLFFGTNQQNTKKSTAKHL